ncbi:MAG: peptidase M6, partial [Acholeplasmataceae bacterium]|nr:peptidase M6 [Acholeplasmataceae bacterium]
MKRVLLFFSVLLIAFALCGVVDTQADTDDFIPDRKIDAGLMLREEKSDAEFLEEAKTLISENAKDINLNQVNTTDSSNFTYNGGTKYFLGYELEFIAFTLRSVGPNVEVWVANNLNYGYPNPYGPDEITQEQVDLLRDEFENNIRPTVTGFFGNEDFHDGSNAVLEDLGYFPEGYYANPEGKVLILVENIKDESYYTNVDVYVAGFYWQALEYYHDLNIVTLDSYAWFALMPNNNPAWQDYQYEVFGTLAHEYQHLIHADHDPSEEKWLNEGMSGFTQYLCGYGHNYTHVEWFLHFPENSLLEWGDYDGTEILADYGQAYLLQLYISEQFGQEFIRALATHPKQGIESLNEVLRAFSIGFDFEELFRRFTVAVAIDNNSVGNGIYEFKSIDLQINYDYAAYYNKEGVPIFGADYSILEFKNCLNRLNLTMGEYYPMAWQVIQGGYLWSNSGYSLDNALIFEADLRR